MQEEVDVLDMVVCLVGSMNLLLRLSGMNPFENA